MTPLDLEQLNKELNQIEVPKEQLAKTRHNAFNKVQKEKNRTSTGRYYFVLTATVVLAFILSVRFIPPFADTVKRVPGFADVVSFFTEQRYDEKQFYEELNITRTKNDLTLTVKGAIIDETGLKIDYSLEAPYDISNLSIKGVTILQDGKEIAGALTYGGMFNEESIKYIEDTIYKSVAEGNLPNRKNFELQITFGDKSETTFKIPFTIKNDVVKKQVHHIDYILSYKGQKLIIKDLTVTPTATRLRIIADQSNSMQILNVDDVRVLNKRGKRLNTLESGLSGIGSMSDGEIIYLFESISPKVVNSLTIEIENMNVLPKDDNYIEVDFKKQQVLRQPAIGQVKFAVKQPGIIKIYEEEENKVRLSHAIDANGEHFTMDSMSSSWNEAEYTYPLDMKSPVKIYFYNYPNTIYFKKEISIGKDQ